MDTLDSFKPLFDIITQQLIPGEQIYLVGGAVRDIMLNRSVHDLDFVTNGHVRRIARYTANKLGGAFYMLDDERETARVIYQQDGLSNVMDFALLRGGHDLVSDLRARDYTINAMALDLTDLSNLIDPLEGAKALHDKTLIACSETSLQDDPCRVLRGVRMALNFNLRVPGPMLKQLRATAPLLERISAERIRDELIKILSGQQVSTAIRILDNIGALVIILPELQALKGVEQSLPHQLDVWEHTLSTVQELERLLNVLAADFNNEASSNLMMGLAVLHLGPYREKLKQYTSETITADRTRRALMFLAALYHDAAKPNTRHIEESGRIRFFDHENIGAPLIAERARMLALSTAEIQFLEKTVHHHMRIHWLGSHQGKPTPRAIYRFFRHATDTGVAICLFSLADLLATYRSAIPREAWLIELGICQAFLQAWFEKPQEMISPVRILNGNEIQQQFSLKPGPIIGQIMEALQEAQVCGGISTREAALEFVHQWLDSTKNKTSPEAPTDEE